MIRMLVLGATALIATLQGGGALAQPFPQRPVSLVLPQPPGGNTDVGARVFAQYLKDRLGQPVIVENKPGAASQIGTDYVVRSKPDGHTLLYTGAGMVTSPAAKREDPQLDRFTYLVMVYQEQYVFAVNAKKVPANTMGELVTYAKANPGKISYASTGEGGFTHLAMALLSGTAGIKLLHVPYNGTSGIMRDFLPGTVDSTYLSGPTIKRNLTPNIKVLAAAAPRRDESFPDVPTLEEVGIKNANFMQWHGIFGPVGMPKAVSDRLIKDLIATASNPEALSKFHAAGYSPSQNPLTGDDFKKFVTSDYQMWKVTAEKNGIVLKE